MLDVRWHISANAKQWDACVNIAGATLKLDPNRPAAWIHRSFAWHKLKRTQEAFNNLLPVADRFPKVWTIPYNLACYCAQLGRLDESQEWLTKARVIDERTVKLAAVDDSDLKPLRDGLSGNLW